MTFKELRRGVLALSMAGGLVLSAPAALAHGGMVDFKSMDANGDGKISTDEHEAAAKKMFERMDANKDGIVTTAEMDAAHEQVAGKKTERGEMSAADKIKVIDTNGDGQLSAEEHEAGAKKMFEKMDTDHDGIISKAELSAGHAKMMMKKASKQSDTK
jgi:Ca2+-binding EF-hand superfamily protein